MLLATSLVPEFFWIFRDFKIYIYLLRKYCITLYWGTSNWTNPIVFPLVEEIEILSGTVRHKRKQIDYLYGNIDEPVVLVGDNMNDKAGNNF